MKPSFNKIALVFIGILVAGTLMLVLFERMSPVYGAENTFRLSPEIIGQWLDDGSNHPAFIKWATEELSQAEIDSLEDLIAPVPDTETKRTALDKAKQVLLSAGLPSTDAAIAVLDSELAKLPTPNVEEVVDEVTPPARP